MNDNLTPQQQTATAVAAVAAALAGPRTTGKIRKATVTGPDVKAALEAVVQLMAVVRVIGDDQALRALSIEAATEVRTAGVQLGGLRDALATLSGLLASGAPALAADVTDTVD